VNPETTTALVTGASSGLGEEYVRQLAPHYGCIIAVARRADRLQALAVELASERADIVPLQADLTTLEGQARAVECIRQQGPLGMLVNNAGFGSFGPFIEDDIDRDLAMLRLHQDAVLLLTRVALPAMRDAGGGYIINVASVGGFVPMPGSAVYAASKAFLNSFSVSLQGEVERFGIRVQSLCPGFTHTEIHDSPDMQGFDKSRTPQGLWMPADEVVRQSLAALHAGTVLLVPGEMNRAMVASALDEERALFRQ